MTRSNKKRKRGLFIFILLAAVLLVASGSFLINWENHIRKGLDLEGGMYVLLEAASTGDPEQDRDAIDRAMTIIRSRIDELGVSEPVLQKEGERRLRVELPGIEDQAQALDAIGRTAQLVFRNPDGEVLLTGANLSDAYYTRGEHHQPIVALEFDAEGREMFAEATQQHLGEPISIYLDDELVSSPTVQQVITDGQAVITGIPSSDEASHIAMLLRSGALPVELEELETRAVGPVLGENALDLSVTAATVGLGIVMIFMMAYYRFAGIVACITLVVYLALVFVILMTVNATLTLPGIAGLILSIGMAVDANILIFERVKEELENNKTVVVAINAGFDRALRAILDANVTTLIAAVVLFALATGPVRGFAVVLMVGIFSSVVTALVLTRYLLRLAARSKLVRTPAFLGLKGV